MSKPLNLHAHTSVTATGASEAVRSKGHYDIALYVSAPNVDTTNDSLTVRVEVSPDGSMWSPLRDNEGNPVEVTQADLTDGHYMVPLNHVLSQQLRTNITAYTDAAGGDLTVDTWLLTGGWPGPAFGV